MIKSCFKIWAFLLPVLLITVTWLLVIFPSAVNQSAKGGFIMIYVIVLLLFTWVWLLFGELRTKAIIVTMNEKSVMWVGFLGLGSQKSINLNKVDGFIISLVPSRTGMHEYLYLIKDGKKIVKLSEFYHSNYHLLRNFLESKVEYLGEVRFSMLTELKEVFQ